MTSKIVRYSHIEGLVIIHAIPSLDIGPPWKIWVRAHNHAVLYRAGRSWSTHGYFKAGYRLVKFNPTSPPEYKVLEEYFGVKSWRYLRRRLVSKCAELGGADAMKIMKNLEGLL